MQHVSDPSVPISLSQLLISIFTFHGRLNRGKFVLGHILINAFCGMVLLLIIYVPIHLRLMLFSMPPPVPSLFWLYCVFAVYVVFIGGFIALASVYVRRLHDINRSGYLSLLFLVPALGQIVFWHYLGVYQYLSAPDYAYFISLAAGIWMALMFTALLVWPGSRGVNRFGADENTGM